MIISKENVKFIDGSLMEKKDKSGFFVILNIQKTFWGWEKQFKKIENVFVDKPTEELIEFIKTAEMGDNFVLETSLVS